MRVSQKCIFLRVKKVDKKRPRASPRGFSDFEQLTEIIRNQPQMQRTSWRITIFDVWHQFLSTHEVSQKWSFLKIKKVDKNRPWASFRVCQITKLSQRSVRPRAMDIFRGQTWSPRLTVNLGPRGMRLVEKVPPVLRVLPVIFSKWLKLRKFAFIGFVDFFSPSENVPWRHHLHEKKNRSEIEICHLYPASSASFVFEDVSCERFWSQWALKSSKKTMKNQAFLSIVKKNGASKKTLLTSKLIENKFSVTSRLSRLVLHKKLCRVGASKVQTIGWIASYEGFSIPNLYLCPAQLWLTTPSGA